MRDAARRVFLFLQGPQSPFFETLATALMERGHEVRRINLCFGDRLFWRRLPAVNYTGDLDAWPSFIDAFIRRERVTDVLLLGDRRPHHVLAANVARMHGATLYSVELGYLRPDWVTLERDGMGLFSRFPRDPDTIRRIAAAVPEPDLQERYPSDFMRLALWDVAFNLANVFLWPFHPHYRWHAIQHPLTEYAGWLLRLARRPLTKRRRRTALAGVFTDERPCYLFPLQLATDYQIRVHSPFAHQFVAIELAIRSFAQHAPPGSRLLFKAHPLDNGLIGWEAFIRRIAQEMGAADRVIYLEGGKLNRLIDRCSGMVTINSTAGTNALLRGRPVIVLGTAVFDVPGLTFQGPIDNFWQNAQPPDAELCHSFVRALAGTILVKGGFYSQAAIKAAAEACAERIDKRQVNEPFAYEDPPPRLIRLRASALADRMKAAEPKRQTERAA